MILRYRLNGPGRLRAPRASRFQADSGAAVGLQFCGSGREALAHRISSRAVSSVGDRHGREPSSPLTQILVGAALAACSSGSDVPAEMDADSASSSETSE